MLSFFLAAVLLTPEKVTLHYANPTAKSVAIAGDLSGWGLPQPMTKQGDGWSISFDLPDDARFEYKFVVDGNWILDPKNPKKNDNGIGGENSAYEGPQYVLRTIEGEPKTPLKRTLLKIEEREAIVFAPARSKNLPILVYGDGQDYELYGKIQNVVQNLVEAKKIRPVVLVLVPPVDRMNEYGDGWKDYADTLFGRILPVVRKLTGASDRARDLFVGGSSMGGAISLRLAEEFPDKVAGGVHSQSGAFMYRGTATEEQLCSQAAFKKMAPTTRLWLCWGAFEGGLTTSNEKATATLTATRRRFGSKVTNEGHNWTAWRNRMADALVYLLGR